MTHNSKTSTLRRLRRLSHLLDNAIPIPGTSWRFGLDPVLGLLPGAGDFLGTAFSAYIVLEAARIGIPRSLLGQMVINILLDTVIGSVPIVGDIADATWKANAKNIELLETYWDSPQPEKQTDWFFLVCLLLGLLIAVTIIATLSLLVIKGFLAVINF
ncbi:hypothetical protein MC7420_1937 [Coleofasciculus chthonoplastes PCC 7420]|uniref:DUF4112 domain-containing protein n=1 Tax=Coleofasciculus chthonoplastes PCC 7420 TaxID=118168 RepID=B4VM74_9CYAN|nr:DUF4112 domain-containing protein [Coleofasciculus chthonoplastes]EDX76934.1 hypothetical protein MC7420_1937 [Coleofasciculus chthonoplastes PCC 7420]